MTCDMYGSGVNMNLTAKTNLNIFKKLEDQIEPKNNERTKINQINKLGTQIVIKAYIYVLLVIDET